MSLSALKFYINMLIKFSLRYESQVAKPPAEMISKTKVDEMLTSFVNNAVDLPIFRTHVCWC